MSKFKNDTIRTPAEGARLWSFRFLLALVPAAQHRPLPHGFHIGFGQATPEAVTELHQGLGAAGVTTTEVEDSRPEEDYVTFRCWDPDGTEVEVFWDGWSPQPRSAAEP